MFCLIIVTCFKSSLISHLTVQAKSKPIDTFEELLNQHDWQWGVEAWIHTGLTSDYFTKHPYPVVPLLYNKMEVSIIRFIELHGIKKLYSVKFEKMGKWAQTKLCPPKESAVFAYC